MVELSRRNADKAGVGDKANCPGRHVHRRILAGDGAGALPPADESVKLRDKFAALKPGTRIVANTFGIEDWTADETVTIAGECMSWCTVLLYYVPASVEGTWETPQGPLSITQQYQTITGTLGSPLSKMAASVARGDLYRRWHSLRGSSLGQCHDWHVKSRRQRGGMEGDSAAK